MCVLMGANEDVWHSLPRARSEMPTPVGPACRDKPLWPCTRHPSPDGRGLRMWPTPFPCDKLAEMTAQVCAREVSSHHGVNLTSASEQPKTWSLSKKDECILRSAHRLKLKGTAAAIHHWRFILHVVVFFVSSIMAMFPTKRAEYDRKLFLKRHKISSKIQYNAVLWDENAWNNWKKIHAVAWGVTGLHHGNSSLESPMKAWVMLLAICRKQILIYYFCSNDRSVEESTACGMAQTFLHLPALNWW